MYSLFSTQNLIKINIDIFLLQLGGMYENDTQEAHFSVFIIRFNFSIVFGFV